MLNPVFPIVSVKSVLKVYTMSLSDEEITRLHRVRKTCFEMLKDRGYEVEDAEIQMTRKEFIDKYNGTIRREDLTFLKSKPDNTDQVCILNAEYCFIYDQLVVCLHIIVCLCDCFCNFTAVFAGTMI